MLQMCIRMDKRVQDTLMLLLCDFYVAFTLLYTVLYSLIFKNNICYFCLYKNLNI